jgi:hypothetical protein
MRTLQRIVSTLVLAAIGVCASLLFVGTAQAATAYRYWTYWQVSNSQWTFAQAGPASTTPLNGSVEGWRFGVSSSRGDQAMTPRFTSSTAFTDICGNEISPTGTKRVALVVDPGLTQHAPRGEAPGALLAQCIQIQDNANGYDVLRQAQPVRTEKGLICAINDYPRQECAEVIDASAMQTDAVTDATTTTVPETTSPFPLIIGVVLVGSLGGLVWKLRKRK